MYIHYGHKEFNPSKFNPIKNTAFMVKPDGGLWGSPVDARYGWQEWCHDNNFRECALGVSFKFSLKENSRILEINSVCDLDNLPKLEGDPFPPTWVILDFEKLLNGGIDAILLNMNNDLYFALYGWDCDSILVMNKDAIKTEEVFFSQR